MDLLTIFSAFTYGLTSSVSLCLATCLPVYMPILVGYGDGARKGFSLSVGFAVGRFIGYGALGVTAAAMGAAFLDFFNEDFPAISSLLVLAFGILTVFYGTLILLKAQDRLLNHRMCRLYQDKTKRLGNPLLGAGFLGLVSTITPCVPVFTFLLLPFAMGKIGETVLLMLAFGAGANVVFIAIGVATGFGVGKVREGFAALKPKLETASAAALIVFGLLYVLWALGPHILGWQYANYILPSVTDLTEFVKALAG